MQKCVEAYGKVGKDRVIGVPSQPISKVSSLEESTQSLYIYISHIYPYIYI